MENPQSKRFELTLKMGRLTHFEKDLVKCKNCGRKVMFLKKHFQHKQYKICKAKYTSDEIDEITEASREHRRKNKNYQQRQNYAARKQVYPEEIGTLSTNFATNNEESANSSSSLFQTNTQLLFTWPEESHKSRPSTSTTTTNNACIVIDNEKQINLPETNCQPSTTKVKTYGATHYLESNCSDLQANSQQSIVYVEDIDIDDLRKTYICEIASKEKIHNTIKKLLNTFKKVASLNGNTQNKTIISYIETKTMNLENEHRKISDDINMSKDLYFTKEKFERQIKQIDVTSQALLEEISNIEILFNNN